MGKSFAFNLGQKVGILVSGESGVVIGRCEYLEGDPNTYYVRYKCADGRAVHAWWPEPALGALEQPVYITAPASA